MNRPRLRIRLLLAALAVLPLLLVAIVHTEWAQRRILTLALARIAPDGSITAEQLDYNLLTLWFRLEAVELRSPEDPRPYFTSAAIELDAPWSALWRPSLEHLALIDPRFFVAVDADGATNFSGGGSRIEMSLPIDRLDLEGLSVRWQDDRYDAAFTADRLDLRIAATAADSFLRQGAAASVRRGAAASAISVDGGTVGWNGLAGLLRDLQLSSEPLDVAVDGEIGELLADRTLDLEARALLRLDGLNGLAPETAPLEGTVAVDAILGGSATAPEIEATLAAPRIYHGRLGLDDVEAALRWNRGLVIDRFVGSLSGGRVSASGQTTLGPEPSSLDVDWEEVALEPLAAILADDGAGPDFAAPPIATRGSGALRLSWVGVAPAVTALTARLEATLRPELDTGLEGTIAATLGSGLAELDFDLHDRARAASARARGTATVLAESPWLAEVEIDFESAADIGLLEAFLPATAGASGNARLVGQVTGDGLNPLLLGRLELVEVRRADTPPLDLRAELRADKSSWTIDSIDAVMPGGRANGRLAGQIDLTHVEGELEATIDDLGPLTPFIPAELSGASELPSIAGSGDLRIDFTASDDAGLANALARALEASVTASLREVSFDGGPPMAGDLRAALASERWRIDRLELDGADARLDLTAAGSLDLLELEGRAALEVGSVEQLLSVVPASLRPASLPPADGNARLEAQFSGGIETLRWAGSVDAANLVVSGWGPFELRGRFEAVEQGTRVDELHLTGQGIDVVVVGTVGPSASAVDLVATASADNLGTLSGRDWLDAVRAVDGTAALIADREAGTLALELRDLTVELPLMSFGSTGPGRLSWGPDGLDVNELRLASGETTLSVDGSLPPTGTGGLLSARLEGDLGDLDDLMAILWDRNIVDGPPAPQATGAFRLELTAAGNLEQFEPGGSLDLREATLTADGVAPVTGIGLSTRVTSSEIRIETIAASWNGASLTGTSSVPLSFIPALAEATSAPTDLAAQIDLQLRSFDPASLSALLAAESRPLPSGVIDAALKLTATEPSLDALRGELRLDSLQLQQDGVQLHQAVPTRLSVEGTRIEVTDWEWVAAGNGDPSIRLAGSIDLDPDAPYESLLDLRIDTDLQLSALNALVPIAALGGRLVIDATVSGSLGAPSGAGRVELDGVSVAVRDPRLQMSALSGTVTIEGTTLQADGITGTANGGDVMISANLDIADLMAPRGLVGITGRGVALQAAAGVRADTDIDLTLSARGEEGMVLLGSITLLEGGYRSLDPLTAASFGNLTSSAPPGEPTGLLDRLRYDIKIRSAEDLVVDTRYADLALSLDLQVVGAGDRPGLLGEARLAEGGQIRLAGNTLVLDRGFIEFDDASRIAPTLDIEASSRVSSYEVTVRLLGNAFSPTLEAQASDGLTEADALSLLTTGRTLAEAGGAGTEILREQAFNVVAGRVEGLARNVGVTAVRFEQAQAGDDWRSLTEPDLFPRTTDLSARLTIKRSFGDRFDLLYSQGLTRSTDRSWIGVLRLPWNLQFSGGVYDDDSRGVELQHGVQFGRAANDPALAAPTIRARINEVRITGTPGRSEAEILRLLNLSAGDRFDYLAWRRDVERLTRSYSDAGYFEAKIQPSRRTIGAVDPNSGQPARIALDYEITRGPRTTLEVRGFALGHRAVERMEQVWQNTVADAFLLEDLASEARRVMVEQRYSTATAQASFTTDTEDQRNILVVLDPGTRYERVRTVIEGADSIPTAEIEDRLRDLELATAVWWAPGEVENAVRGLYQQRGFPAAHAEVRAPRFEGSTASALIVIDEGAPRRIDAIRFVGNTTIADEELRAKLPDAPGGILTRGWLDSAALSIDAAYLDLAYNDAQTGASTAASDGGVEVVFAVHEGPRRVLAGIEVAGRSKTRESVVRNAIGMQPGDPLVLSKVQAIRRRLLATGAFRSASVQVRDAGPATDGTRPADLLVTVVEQAVFDLHYGVQVLSDTFDDQRRTRPGVGALLAHNNFLGVGARVSVLGRYRSDEPFGRIAMSFPRFFGAPIRTTMLVQRSREQSGGEAAFTVRREETRALLEQRLQLGRLSLGYSYSWERNLNQILELPPDSPFQLPAIKVARMIPTIIWDSRNDGFAPTRGLFHSSTFEFADSGLGSELEFAKYYGQQFVFTSVGPVVLATGVRFGSGKSNDPNSTILPRGELFLAGGGTSVRGYPDDSIGRTEFFGSYFAGGNAVLILNQEARFPIWQWVEGVAFVDAGSAFQSTGEIRLSSLAYSAGAGLRLVTPFITLRLDYGFRLTDIDYLDPATGSLHFGIGHIF